MTMVEQFIERWLDEHQAAKVPLNFGMLIVAYEDGGMLIAEFENVDDPYIWDGSRWKRWRSGKDINGIGGTGDREL